MKKPIHLILLAVVLLGSGTFAQTTQSLVFRLRVPGGSTQAFNYNVSYPQGTFTFSLNDNFSNQNPYEVGIGLSGTIGVITTSASGGKLLSCSNASTFWSGATTQRTRMDITPAGVVWSIGTDKSIYKAGTDVSAGYDWLDIGAAPDGNVWAVRSDNTVCRWNSGSSSWTVTGGASAVRIDGGPSGKCAVVNTSGDLQVYNGSAWTVCGKPAGYSIADVGIGTDNTPWVVAGNHVYSYQNSAWLLDAGAPTGQSLYNISVGPDNEPAVTGYFTSGGPLPNYNLFKRLGSGRYTTLDVDPAAATVCFYNIQPGTYTASQVQVAGWSVADLYQLGGGANSSTSQNTASMIMGVDNDEASVVEIVNVNCTPAFTTIGNICGSGYKEDFGSGANPYGSPIGCGETTQLFKNTSGSVEDGQYSIVSNVSTGGNSGWVTGQDHSGTGNMMLINADYTPGVFFNRTFSGFVSGASYDFSAWIANILKASTGGIPVNITFRITDPATGTVVDEESTGDIANSNSLVWKRYALSFIASKSVLNFQLVNNSPGGSGNDLVLDDITVDISSDHGDAPDSYGTLMSSNGPCHLATGSLLRLGATEDTEPDGFPGANANGDDNDNRNDDDGVAIVPVLNRNSNSYSLTASVYNSTGSSATLRAWADFNNNGIFDPQESVTTIVANGFSGNKVITWNNISVANMTKTFARLRLSTKAFTSAEATGTAPDGEVEDYKITVVNPVPVSLISFTATPDAGCNAALYWATATEINTAAFIIEQSADGINFIKTGEVACRNMHNGSSYNFTADVTPGYRHFYRLKIMDNDGKFEYSPVVKIVISCKETPQIAITPNPTNDYVTVSGLTGISRIVVTNAEGRELQHLSAAGHTVKLSMADYSSGIYFITVAGTGSYKVVRK